MLYRECFQHLYEIERKRIPDTPKGHLRLQRLERPVSWPGDHHDSNLYPHYPPLYEAISRHEGVPVNKIVVGAGIESLVRDLVMLSCDPGDGFMFTWPTCAMFDIYARVFGAEAQHLITDPDDWMNAVKVVTAVRELKPKLLLLPNPGQPVEVCFDLAYMREIARACLEEQCVFAVDEAYYGFGAPSALPLIDEFDNVVVLRTFSKAWGIAGLRVGFAMGSHAAVHPLEACRLSGEVTGMSSFAVRQLIEHFEPVVLPGIADIIAGREWLRDALRKRGFDARGQWANHVLVRVGSPDVTARVVAGLRERGIHVKGDYSPPLDHHVLVTAGPPSMMKEFYDHFVDVFSRCRQEEVPA